MEQACAQVEQACRAFQSPSSAEERVAAEKALLAFRGGDAAATLAAAQHLLQHSALPFAQFQAAAALKEAALRAWHTMPPAERAGPSSQDPFASRSVQRPLLTPHGQSRITLSVR